MEDPGKTPEPKQTDIFRDSNSLDHDGGDGKKGIFKFLNINKQRGKFRNINTVNTTS